MAVIFERMITIDATNRSFKARLTISCPVNDDRGWYCSAYIDTVMGKPRLCYGEDSLDALVGAIRYFKKLCISHKKIGINMFWLVAGDELGL